MRGTLDVEARRAAEEHIASCSSCREVLAILVRTTSHENTDRAALALKSGARVGRYLIGEELGQGAMGIVYLADDVDLHRKVAVKVLRGRTADATPRLQREAQALARVSHPNVIVVYEVGTFEGHVFMAMEFVDGTPLAKWQLERPRSVPEVVDIFTQAGRGLAIAHEAGLVHRDFKPDNVLVGRDGRVRVVDFGLAREDEEVGVRGDALGHGGGTPPVERSRSIAPDARGTIRTLTRTGAVVGTPAYMAPEQLAGSAADARTDQFAFAVALFEALFRVRPFVSESIDLATGAVTRGPVQVPRHARVPKRIERAVLRALSTPPEARFGSMGALLAELSPTPARSRMGSVAIVFAVASAAVLVVLALRPYVRAHHPVAEVAVTAPSIATNAAQPSAAAVPSAIDSQLAPDPTALPAQATAATTRAPAVPTRSTRAQARDPSGKKARDCNPAFVVDSQGIEHLKEGCF
jgi:predicted Ser/Thr protein kinase